MATFSIAKLEVESETQRDVWYDTGNPAVLHEAADDPPIIAAIELAWPRYYQANRVLLSCYCFNGIVTMRADGKKLYGQVVQIEHAGIIRIELMPADHVEEILRGLRIFPPRQNKG